MNTLTNYGIMPKLENGESTENALTSLLHNEKSTIEPAEFYAESCKLLMVLGDVVMSEIVPELEEYYGRWHPSGFMVYQLGSHDKLGLLRLHIWPEGLRRRAIKGVGRLGDIYDGDIHNHAWNLSSLALRYYCDNMYEVTDINEIDLTNEEIIERELFRVYNVTYEENVSQALTPNGRIVKAEISQQRVANQGEIHTIAPGLFHSPTIPISRLGSTLVLDSFRVIDGPDILVRGTNDPIRDTRQTISKDEAILAKNQLLAK